MTGPAGAPFRRGYLDWMRGVAVLIMIEAHTIDSWTRASDRRSAAFGDAMILGGFGAPAFLFLAGVAVVMSAGSKLRRGATVERAAAEVRRRGWQIFGLAFLFRLQSYLLNPGSSPSSLLKVDILNVMGPSIAAAATLWGLTRGTRTRIVSFAAATIAIAMMTPPIRATPILDVVPNPIEWYLRPVPGRTNFTLFPWAGFVLAGGIVGTLLDAAQSPRDERRVNVWLAAASLAVAAASYGASLLPPIYEQTNFWTSSPTFFFLRCGLLTACVPIGYAWQQRPWRLVPWRPMETFGRSSLFVYWIHVEMVYGVLTQSLHKRLSIGRAFLAFAVFTLFLFGLVLLKNRAVAAWREWRSEPRTRQNAIM